MCVCIPVYTHGRGSTCHMCVWESEDMQELATYFHSVAFQVGTRVIRVDGRCLYPRDHLAQLAFTFCS